MVTSRHKLVLSSGRFSGTSREQLAAAFDAFRESPQKDRLVLHFHGGLVSEADAEAIAARLLPVYRDRGGGYPLFTIWQAGLGETLRNNWREIVAEDVFPRLVERVTQFVWGKLDRAPGEKGARLALPSRFAVEDEIRLAEAGEEPLAGRETEAANIDPDLTPAERDQFAELLRTDTVLAQAADRLLAEEAVELAPELEKEAARARAARVPEEKGLIETAMLVGAGLRILGRTLGRLRSRRDHGIYTTIVEETARELRGDLVGGIIWRNMKKDTADSFDGPADRFGGSALLEEIGRLHADGHRPRILLVGHSTGAVYICHLLNAAAERLPPEARFEVVFLAPACSFALMRDTVARAGDRVAAFRSFGMEDRLEKRDRLFPPFYLRSLLYFVSGVVESEVDLPLVGMKRYHGGDPFTRDAFPEIAAVLDFAERFPAPWLWSIADAGPGLRTEAAKHGDFDNDPATLDSVVRILAAGIA